MTPSKTAWAGLERLGPGDPISSDNYIFQDLDRATIDRLLQVGAVTHVHDGHAALANPTLAPTLTLVSSGGTIPAGQTVYATYTLLDAYGGESAPVAPLNVTTSAGYTTPTAAPTATIDYTAGLLLAANYSYAITVTDGLGGETPLGPPVYVIVNPGSATATVDLAGLDTAATSASGVTGSTWRLWRQISGSAWYLIASGTGATFNDNGVAGDCTQQPPLSGTTVGSSSITFTVPTGQPSGTVNFNIYGSYDGSFSSPALLATLPVASLGVAQTFTALSPASGAPPPLSRCFGGANPISALALINLARAIGTKPATTQAAAYTFALADVGTVVESTSATAVTFTIPPHSTTAFDYPGLSGALGGAVIEVFQAGAGQVTIAGGTGVTLQSNGSLVHTAAQYATIRLRQRALDTWALDGQLA
jgi:hypothetical protein